ncbi:MAG: hypothetical protein JW704_06355 [Anaerolineaceae bacterium]|nr:hypothetical protein [Anaerolineaceae bacterium]MBN2678500.1 hypothetical protein [Anaerolineaceae bacterium]
MYFDQYGWYIDEQFTPDQVRLILAAVSDLKVYLNQVMDGSGSAWIRLHTWGTRVHRGGMITKIAARINKLPTSLVLPFRDIWLWESFDRFHLPKRHFLHELGHVVENRLPKKCLLPPTILGGGASDRLIRFLGGKPSGLRFMNGTTGIPECFLWRGPGIYGNHASADYFAEAFSWLPYNPAALPDPSIAQWFKEEVFVV